MTYDYLVDLAGQIGADLPEATLATETEFALEYLSRIRAYHPNTPSSAQFTPRFLAALSIMADAEPKTSIPALTPAAIAWVLDDAGIDTQPTIVGRATKDEKIADTVERSVAVHAGLHLAGHGEPSKFMTHLEEEYDLTEQRDHLAELTMRRLGTDPRFSEYAPHDEDIAEAINRCCVVGQYMGERPIIESRLRMLSTTGQIVSFDVEDPDTVAAAARAIEEDARQRGLPHRGARQIANEAIEAAFEGAWMGMPALLDLPALQADQGTPAMRRKLRAHLAVVLITLMRAVGGFMPGDETVETHVMAYMGDPDPPALAPMNLIELLVEEIHRTSIAVAQAENDDDDDGRSDDMDELASMTPEHAAAVHLVGDLTKHPNPLTEAKILWATVYGLPRAALTKTRGAMTKLGLGPDAYATGGQRKAMTVVWEGKDQLSRWDAIAIAAADASRHAPSGFALMSVLIEGREIVVHAARGTVTTMTKTPAAYRSSSPAN